MDNQQYICSQCKDTYTGKRGDAEMMTQKLRESKGCFSVGNTPVQEVDDISFYTCVGNFFSNQAAHYLGWFKQYEKGNLPYPGSLSEQPNKITEIFDVISLRDVKKKEADLKQQLAQQKKQRIANRGIRGR